MDSLLTLKIDSMNDIHSDIDDDDEAVAIEMDP
jgi:hypothetical protein